MALPGKGGDRTSDAVKDVRSALELAQDGTADQGVLDRQSTKFVQNILDLGVDGIVTDHIDVLRDVLAERGHPLTAPTH